MQNETEETNIENDSHQSEAKSQCQTMELDELQNSPELDRISLVSVKSNTDAFGNEAESFHDHISLISFESNKLESEIYKASESRNNIEEDWLEKWFSKKVNSNILKDEDLISKEESDRRIIAFEAITGLSLSLAQVCLIVWIAYLLIPNDPKVISVKSIDKLGKILS